MKDIIQFDLTLTVTPVSYWGYEHAFCTDRIATIGNHNLEATERKAEYDKAEAIYHQLQQLFKVNPDNKQTFCVLALGYSGDPVKLYITWHDNCLYIGTGVRGYHGPLPEPDRTYS